MLLLFVVVWMWRTSGQCNPVANVVANFLSTIHHLLVPEQSQKVVNSSFLKVTTMALFHKS